MTGSVHDVAHWLRRHPIWRESPIHLLKQVSRHGRLEHFFTGSNIIRSGVEAQEVYLLVEGHVRVFYVSSKQDREVTVKLFKAPAAFGDDESILRVKRVCNVKALMPSKVLIFQAEPYFRTLSMCPQASFRQLWDLGNRFALAIRTERQATIALMESRLMTLFVSYAEAFGEVLPDGVVRIEHSIDQQTLAAALGSTPRTVTRALSLLYKRELLSRRGHDFIVPDLNKLKEAIGEDVASFSYSTAHTPWVLSPGKKTSHASFEDEE